MNDSSLTTADAARILGLHPSTAKRWCDDGVLQARRTSGGHRRLSLRDVLGVANARGIDSPLSSFGDHVAPVWEALQEAERGRFDAYVGTVMGRLLEHDPGKIGPFTELLLTHPDVDPTRVLDDGVSRLMKAVGRGWAAGEIGVADERLVSTQVAEGLIHASRARAEGSAAAARPGSAIVAAPDLNIHMIGALCVRLVLEAAGWNVSYLGGGVPVQEIARMQAERGHDLVCLSFAPPAQGPDVLRAVRTLAASYDARAPYRLAVGGAPTTGLALSEAGQPFRRTGRFETLQSFLSWLDYGGSG